MISVKEALQKAVKILQEHDVLKPKFSAEVLLAHVLNIKPLDIYGCFGEVLEDEQIKQYNLLVARRSKKEPLEYILGEVLFCGSKIMVNKNVLIPRVETEYWVNWAIEIIKHGNITNKVAYDLCCGSGAIAIALKKCLPEINVCMSDISEEALEVGRKNCKKNNVNITIRKGDFFDPFKGEKTDFIFCNPPYVSQDEYFALSKEVRDFEPKIALLAEHNGLIFYETLAKEAFHYLNPKGKLFFEIGYNQGETVFDLFKNGPWKRIEKNKDLSGHDRFFFLEIE